MAISVVASDQPRSCSTSQCRSWTAGHFSASGIETLTSGGSRLSCCLGIEEAATRVAAQNATLLVKPISPDDLVATIQAATSLRPGISVASV
jgi:hypothetical protein